MSDSDSRELQDLVEQETKALHRVLQYVKQRASKALATPGRQYDAQLVELRDQIAEARLEDIPPLIERMSQLQHIMRHQSNDRHGVIPADSPYFGRLVVEEEGQCREILIGTTTCVDTQAGIRIVDWRDAPVSRLYYRYEEGEEYFESFGSRQREGAITVKRSITIVEGALQRISSPTKHAIKHPVDGWTLSSERAALEGGEGASARVGKSRLGGARIADEDHRLKQITALIDRRQFEVITRPDSGLVVIQGGAGSGKTTIGLHRMAYLSFHNKRRFAADRMLVVVFNEALARYIGAAADDLGLSSVAIRTFSQWAVRLRRVAIPALSLPSTDFAPVVVTRLKRHSAMVKAVELYVGRLKTDLNLSVCGATPPNSEIQRQVHGQWNRHARKPLTHQLARVLEWVETAAMPPSLRHTLARRLRKGLARANDVVTAWAELLTDPELLQEALKGAPGEEVSEDDLDEAVRWCTEHATEVQTWLETTQEHDRDARRNDSDGLGPDARFGTDGVRLDEPLSLTPEDDTILLCLLQRLKGPLLRGGSKEPLQYEHVFVDEAQDLSPLELGVLMATVTKAQCVTLAGDAAQRLHMHNGFTTWNEVLPQLSLRRVDVQPLRLSYRSTQPILDFAHAVLADLAPDEQPQAKRSGAPVELFRFAHTGEAVAFLASALRDLRLREPRASVAVITRHPALADLYHDGLQRAETPNVRRVREQDFSFKPGVDVTDVLQVKGLEFDYVILDVSDSYYPATNESRHLIHIAATRAAHQLWLVTTESPTDLMPPGSFLASASAPRP